MLKRPVVRKFLSGNDYFVRLPCRHARFFVSFLCTRTAMNPQPEWFIVRGRIRRPDGSPHPAVTVKAFDKYLRSERLLGQDSRNPYEISYTAAQFRRTEKGSADLVVRVFSQDGTQLAESEIVFNAPAETRIDLT